MSNSQKAKSRPWIDGHCHLADPRLEPHVASVISHAQEQNIGQFIMGGYSSRDWDRQTSLQKQFGSDVVSTTFGLHPWWVASNDQATVDFELNKLSEYLHDKTVASRPVGLGELGLDHSKRFDPEALGRQYTAFQNQLELNQIAKLPLVLHIVRAHDLALKTLKTHRSSLFGGIVHSFSGDLKAAKGYVELGFTISISGTIGRPTSTRLQEVVRALDLSQLSVESDAPDQPHPEFTGALAGLNEPSSLLNVASSIAMIKSTTREIVLEKSTENLVRVFHL